MPSKTVITIAMTDGAFAEEIAREVATRLGYRYINNEILDAAAEEAGVDAKTVAAVEHSESLIGRVMRSLASSPMEMGGYFSAEMVIDQTPGYRQLIQSVVRSIATEGQVVIGAHGASMSLAGSAGLLRVLVTAALETRVTRVAAERNISPADARKAVETTDRERKGYLERFFHIKNELPTHYDLVVNTEVLSVEAAAGLIASAAN